MKSVDRPSSSLKLSFSLAASEKQLADPKQRRVALRTARSQIDLRPGTPFGPRNPSQTMPFVLSFSLNSINSFLLLVVRTGAPLVASDRSVRSGALVTANVQKKTVVNRIAVHAVVVGCHVHVNW